MVLGASCQAGLPSHTCLRSPRRGSGRALSKPQPGAVDGAQLRVGQALEDRPPHLLGTAPFSPE